MAGAAGALVSNPPSAAEGAADVSMLYAGSGSTVQLLQARVRTCALCHLHERVRAAPACHGNGCQPLAHIADCHPMLLAVIMR